MSANFVYQVPSDKTVNFTEALAQNAASAMNNLVGLPSAGTGWWFIRAILVLAKQNFGPSINFFNSKNGFGVAADPATDAMVSLFSFSSAMGQQLGGGGLWRYYADGLAIPYIDQDAVGTANQPAVHVVLGNISATPKNASPAGNVAITIWAEPMQAY